MVNGMLLFLGSQGDRVLVGAHLGQTELGLYAAVLLLIANPSSVLARYFGATFLPRVADKNTHDASFAASNELGGASLLLAIAMSGGFALVAPLAVNILYGHRFAQSATLFALVGILQSARFIRFWPNTIAIAGGQTGIVLANNLVRLVALPLGLLSVALFHSLEAVVACFIFGEFGALLTSVFLVNVGSVGGTARDLERFGLFALASGLILAWPAVLSRHDALGYGIVAASLGTVLVVGYREWPILVGIARTFTQRRRVPLWRRTKGASLAAGQSADFNELRE
jgi:O-antigen/teichoic acid export membrane protein